MTDFNARHIIEALRSGIPSRAVGAYFSEARPAMLRKLNDRMEAVRQSGHSEGTIFTGRYGEGKTHLLNTVFSQATASNMVVSYVSLGKESPVDKPWMLFQKLMANTYLPGALKMLEKTLESPWDCKEIHPKGNQSWVFTGRIDVEDVTPIIGHLM